MSTNYLCTNAEAKALIKATKKCRIKVWVRPELPIDGEPGKVFPGSALVSIARTNVPQLIDDLLGPTLEARGGRLPVSVSVWESEFLGKSTTIYIG